MAVALLIVAITSYVLQTCLNKFFGKKEGLDPITFSAMQAFFAMLVFLCTSNGFGITPGVVAFSGGFALVWASATVFGILAFKYGTMYGTSLVLSFSMMIPTLYGIIFLNEPLKVSIVIGLVLLVVSLFLVNYVKTSDDTKKEGKISPIWIIFVGIAFLTNGGCSVVQKMEQVVCDGLTYSGMFMVIAMAFCSVALLIVALIKNGLKTVWDTVKKSWFSALVVGGSNGLLNFLIIKLNPLMPASILFSTFAAGTLVLGIAVSFVFFRERFTKQQTLGFVAGVLAVVMLNI